MGRFFGGIIDFKRGRFTGENEVLNMSMIGEVKKKA
jgi:hypothetical protein